MSGLKYDTDKLRWDLIPPKELEEIVKVISYGAAKYTENNWQQVEPFRARYEAALLRHISKWRQGEANDPESGLHHLAHVMCNALFLMWKENNP